MSARTQHELCLRWPRWARGAIACTVCLAICTTVFVVLTARGAEAPEGPVSVRRLLLPPERLQDELKKLQDGALVRMPRTDFEARLREAGPSREDTSLPRLAEANYHATLKESALVGGVAWKLTQAGPGPGVFPLQPFNLAVQQALFENREAFIGDFDGKGPGLLVEGPGDHALALQWSARGEARPEGLQFDLKFPPCAVGVLELNVPVDRAVAALDTTPVSGPHPAEAADRRLWKLFCGGRNQVNLLVRPPAPAAPAAPLPLTFVRQQRTTQRLSPEGVEATFELSLEVRHPGARELVLACDPELRARDVTAPALEGWEHRPTAAGKPASLIVRLREPLREGALTVTCLAPLGQGPLPSDGARHAIDWHCPAVWLPGAVPGGERIELFLPPQLQVEQWRPGAFRVVSAAPARAEPSAQQIVLSGGGIAPVPGGDGARPQARLLAHGADFRARQLLWWRPSLISNKLALQIAYEVQHGLLFQLPVLLPTGWEPERVEAVPAGLVRTWGTRPEGGRLVLLVDLQRPLGADQEGPPARPAVLSVQLRPTGARAAAGTGLAFPEAVPLGARSVEGTLAIDYDPQAYRATLNTKAEPVEPDEDGPWGLTSPAWYTRYHGAAPAGALQLMPRLPELRARCQAEVSVASGRAALEAHLLLEAQAGSTSTIDLLLPAAVWDWREEGALAGAPARPVVQTTRHLVEADVAVGLAPLAAGGPLQAAVLTTARPLGQHYQLTLSRPLAARETLHLVGAVALTGEGRLWETTLPVVLGAQRMEGELTLRLPGPGPQLVSSTGLREAPSAPGARAAPWRNYRYGPRGAHLVLRHGALSTGRPLEAVIDRAALTTFLSADGPLLHTFRFDASHWPEDHLAIRLPGGARFQAVQVDGHWLPSVGQSEGAEGEGAELRIPVPASQGRAPQSGPHHFEVVYVTSGPQGLLADRLGAPAPRLPIEPTSFRRTWRLPPGVVPLRDTGHHRLPGAGGPWSSATVHCAADLFQVPGVPRPWPVHVPDQARAQALSEAALALRAAREPKSWSLGEVVEALAFSHLRDRWPLVLDVAGLHQAGFSARTQLPQGGDEEHAPWEAVGLVAIPAGPGVLLTTQAQLAAWALPRNEGRLANDPLAISPSAMSLPPDVIEALQAAASFGQDASGRFRTALAWLRPDVQADRLAAGSPHTLAPGQDLASWTEWEPAAGTDEAALVVVWSAQVHAAALFLCVLLVLAGWSLRRWHWRLRLTLLLALLAGAGVGVAGLPGSLQVLAWWPLVGGCVVGTGWYLVSLRRTPAPRLRTGYVAGVLALSLTSSMRWDGPGSASAQPPGPTTVYVLPAGPGEAEEVLVPAQLLDRLRAQARRTIADRPAAVALSARYEGKVEEGAAEVAAVFTAYASSDQPASLFLPLDGVQLVGETWIDGARAHPVAHVADARSPAGYSLTLKGRGLHKVELRFRTPLAVAGDGQAVRMTLPPLTQSHLSFRLPAGTAQAQALVSYGAQWETVTADGKRLEADLGRLTVPLQVIWVPEARLAPAPQVFYRAAYLWDLRPDASTLQAVVRYRIARGAVTTLELALPPELEVRSAQTYRPRDSEDRATPVRLEDVRTDTVPGGRRLRLKLAGPVFGDLDVLLELLPRSALPAILTLPLPVPLGEHFPDDSYLAYRAWGLDARPRPGHLLRVTGIRAQDFAPFWPASSRPDPATLVHAYTFRNDPVLQLQVRRPEPVFDAVQEVSLRTGLHQAQLKATLTLSVPQRDLTFCEWQVHSARPFVATQVSGRDLRTWSQEGDRVRVWLARTGGTTQLELTGWLAVGQEAGAGSRLDLPCLRLMSVRRQETTLRVAAAGEVMVAPWPGNSLQGLTPVAGTELQYRTSQWDYGGALAVRPAPRGPAEASLLTVPAIRGGKLTLTTSIVCVPPKGGARALRVELRGWDDCAAQLQGPGQVRGPRTGPEGRSWTVAFPTGMPADCRLTLSVERDIEEAAGAALPEVSVLGAGRTEHWIALPGPQLHGEPRGALEEVPDKALTRWPVEAERLATTGGKLWKVTGPRWELRVAPAATAKNGAGLEVYLCEMTASLVDQRRWLHEAVWWLHHPGHAEVAIDFPAAIRVVGLSVDGTDRSPVQTAPTSLWLPLSGGPATERVRVRWMYERSEPLERPNFDRPRIVGAGEGRSVWTLRVPAGWDVVAPSGPQGLGKGATRSAALDLFRAEAQFRALQSLGPSGRDAQFESGRRYFAGLCRHAGQALASGADGSLGAGPESESLTDWLEALKRAGDALPPRHRTPAEAVPDEQPIPGLGCATDRGVPVSWQAAAGEVAPTPRLVLVAARSEQATQLAAGRWLGLVGLVWLVAMVGPLAALARRLWPEQAALVGAWGWYVAGPTALVAFLLLVGALGRAFLVGSALRQRARRRHAPSTAVPALVPVRELPRSS